MCKMKCNDLDVGKLISRYEMNLLSEKERNTFEAHLLQCDVCFQDLYAMSPIMEVLRQEKAELKKVIKLESEPSASLVSGLKDLISKLTAFDTPILKPAWGAMAVVGVFIIAVILTPLPEKYQEMAAIEPIEYQPFRVMLKGLQEEIRWQDLFDEGMDFYAVGNYSKAIDRLAKAYELNSTESEITFYLGLCFLMENAPDSTIKYLTLAKDAENAYLPEATHWYLGNAYLLQENVRLAEVELQKVLTFKGNYFQQAQVVLTEIDQRQSEFILLKALKNFKLKLLDLISDN